MTEHLFRQRQPQRHQKDGPIDGVEADDVFADDVHVGRPIFCKQRALLALRLVAEAGDVVGERVQPNVHDVAGIEVDGDAPGEGGARHAQILQAGLQEVVDHLVFAREGQDEVGVLVVVLHEAVCVLAHAEEVRLLLGGVHLSAAVGALAVFELRGRPKGLARGAVHPLVRPFIDIPLLVQLAEDGLHLRLVVGVGGADELVVGDVHQVPDALDLVCDAVDELFGRLAGGLGLFFDLLAVLVGARLKAHVVALVAAEARDGVRQHDLVGVADVRLARGVGDRRGDVIGSLFHASPPAPAAAGGAPHFLCDFVPLYPIWARM